MVLFAWQKGIGDHQTDDVISNSGSFADADDSCSRAGRYVNRQTINIQVKMLGGQIQTFYIILYIHNVFILPFADVHKYTQ